ncbi:MAG: UDP-3-O-acyl-N-acetylglucosamine deacetylase [candidate division WOR-3 bacterium]
MHQKTIKSSIAFQGIGLLFGNSTKVILRPAPPNTGIVFNEKIRAINKNSFIYRHSLGLKDGPTRIYGVEHLLAACYGLGIDNLLVSVLGKEVSFGDGSALPFVRLMQRAGIKNYKVLAKTLSLKIPIIVSVNSSFILALPGQSLSINCFIHFPQRRIGCQFWGDKINSINFQKVLAPARTFGQYQNELLLSQFLPFSLQNENGIILPKVLRQRAEPVCHKVLDLLGHLALLNCRLNAEIFAFKPSHQLNQKFCRRLELFL